MQHSKHSGVVCFERVHEITCRRVTQAGKPTHANSCNAPSNSTSNSTYNAPSNSAYNASYNATYNSAPSHLARLSNPSQPLSSTLSSEQVRSCSRILLAYSSSAYPLRTLALFGTISSIFSHLLSSLLFLHIHWSLQFPTSLFPCAFLDFFKLHLLLF